MFINSFHETIINLTNMLNYVTCLFNNSKCVAKLWKQESPVKSVVACLSDGCDDSWLRTVCLFAVTEDWLLGSVTEFPRRHRRPDVDNQHDPQGELLEYCCLVEC